MVATNTWSNMGPRALKVDVPSELRSKQACASQCRPHWTNGSSDAASLQTGSFAFSAYGIILPLMTGKCCRSAGEPKSSTCLCRHVIGCNKM